MITICWLVWWLLNSTPQVYRWNDWAVGLVVCVLIDILIWHDEKN